MLLPHIRSHTLKHTRKHTDTQTEAHTYAQQNALIGLGALAAAAAGKQQQLPNGQHTFQGIGQQRYSCHRQLHV